MTWGYSESGDEGAKLTFGKEGTDDVPIMLICQPRSERIQVSVSGPDQVIVGAVLELRSGRIISRLHATYEGDDGLGARIEATTTSHDAALHAFAATGRLSVEVPGNSGIAPTSDLEPIRRFLRRCAP